MGRQRANLLLLITAFIWGTAFLAQKFGNDLVPPLLFVGIRFSLSAAVLLPLAIWEMRRHPAGKLSKTDAALAVFIGLCLFAGTSLQQVGLTETSVSNSGFLTSLYVLLVPIIAWFVRKDRPRAILFGACCLSVAGAWLLTSDGQGLHFTRGDVLIIVADLAWAMMIVAAPVFLERTGRPFLLCLIQYFVTALLGLIAGWDSSPVAADVFWQVAPSALYAGIVSGGIAFTLQIVAQRYAPPVEAALILSLENVFAALSGAVWLDERLSVPALCGCGLIMVGVLLPDLFDEMMRRRRAYRSL